jgi:CDP-diacylglycerol pyrophosphatase
MNITPKHVEALRYIASNDYCRPGMQRPDLANCVQDLKDAKYVVLKSDFNRARLCLTVPGQALMNSLTK